MATLLQEVESTNCYQYSPLPSAKHIRLLQIHPRSNLSEPIPFYTDDERIKISVTTVCLDDNPRYDALSYTWGNPMTVYRDEDEANRQVKLFQEPCEILCNEKPLKVTRNLHDALLSIRSIPSRGSYEKAHGSDYTGSIWIDAICINQQDVEERNSQVKVMDQIYSKSRMTIIWLGRDDFFTRTAAPVFSRIVQLRPDQIKSLRAQILPIRPRGTEDYGISDIDDAGWLAVYAFLNRSWFMRVWIIQEVALATRVVILCGKLMLSWSSLVQLCDVLDQSKIYESIEVVAASYMKNKSQHQPDHQNMLSSQVSLYQTQKPPHFYPSLAIMTISQIRSALGFKDALLTYATKVHVPHLTRLTAFFRSSITSEQKDRVYGFLGLSPTKTIVPDYKRSVETVYLDAICDHLEKVQTLSFLGDVQDLSRKSLKELPSWIPDYTVEMFPQRFSSSNADKFHFNAADDVPLVYSLMMQPTPVLQLQGYVVCVVEDVVEFGLEFNLTDTLELLWDFPHLYKADVNHRADEITGDLSGTFSLKVEGGYLRGVEVADENEHDENSANESEAKLLPTPQSSKPWLANPRLQTHVEVLWRTLIADTWEGEHPAPIEAGFAFADSIILKMYYLCSQLLQLAAETPSEGPVQVNFTSPEIKRIEEADLNPLFHAFEVLAESEFNGFTKIQDMDLVTKDGEVELLNSADSIVRKLSRETVSEMLTQFLPIFESYSDVLNHKIDTTRVALWTRRFGQFIPGRKIFRTGPYQFLGAGPTSVEAGDAVCVLAGGDVPYLLRKASSQNGDRYTFVGEAYVHGLMHGEVKYIMELENESWTDIALV